MRQKGRGAWRGIGVVIVVVFCGFGLWASPQYVTPIATYHHIDHSDYYQPNWVGLKNFEYQMAFLKNNGYRVIRFSELVETLAQKKPLDRKAVVITFDDGYENNYTAAFPVLRKYQFPATIFICSDFVGQPGYLTWAQIKEMKAYNIDFGCHTRTHVYLPDVPAALQQEEILGCKRTVEKNIGPIELFAYPVGGFTPEIKEILKANGYKAACTTNRGYDRLNKDLFEIKRVRMTDRDIAPLSLWGKFSGYYNFFRRSRDPY